MHVHELIAHYGMLFYPLVTGLTFLEGESVVILSGAAARTGAVSLVPLIACAWLGSFLGDQFWFAIARRHGKKALARLPGVESRFAKASSLLERHSVLFILCYRFVYGFRNVASLAIGASKIPWLRFALLNFVSAGIWACTFAIGGYMAGAAMEQAFGKASGLVATVVAACILAACMVAWLRHRRHQAILRAAMVHVEVVVPATLPVDSGRPVDLEHGG